MKSIGTISSKLGQLCVCYLLSYFLGLFLLVQESNSRQFNTEERHYVSDDETITSDYSRRNEARLGTIRPWPDATIPYEISPSFNDTIKNLIVGAMKEISSKTCVEFVPRDNEDNFVFIRLIPNQGCFTQMGMRGGRQFLTLDNFRCLQHGRIMHELMHSLGFSHEHQRPDRDEFIEIMWDNIKPYEYSQFTKHQRSVEDVLGLPYDLESITHYANVSPVASIDVNKPIILPKVRTNVMGQREYLSDLDVHKINSLYECAQKSNENKVVM